MFFSPLQFIIIIAWFVFFIFAIDAFQRKKFNILHFLIFFWWSIIILIFTLNVDLLNRFGSFFWLNRWADLLVYISIIWLAYFYFEILNKITRQSYKLSKMISEQAIQQWLSDWIIKNLIQIKWEKSEYLFLIRAYNESKTINKVIDEIFKKWFSNIIIINDWSIDDTLNILLSKKDEFKNKNICILSHLVNRWGWAANKTWFEFLKRYWNNFKNIKWVITFDADWQMDINDTDIFIKNINKWNYDVLLWSRFIIWWNAKNIPLLRKIILFWSKIITYCFNWIWLTDPHNWFRFIKLSLFQDIKIFSDNMTYASELLDEIKRLKLKYLEIPVNILYTDYTISKWQKNSNAIKIFLEIIYKKFFFK